MAMLEDYKKSAAERGAIGLPPLPLSPAETEEVCRFLEKPDPARQAEVLGLLTNRVAPGVDPAARVKAEWLAGVARGTVVSPAVSERDAVALL
ncbi:MAG: aconitate hydratase B, partial [Candidatus Aminicenantes bacterium]|nr:aconitate hydratase B [Candidatus Aminicenantes bacterium]